MSSIVTKNYSFTYIYLCVLQTKDNIFLLRFKGQDPRSGNFVATAPDELDILVDVYPVQPITNLPIKVKLLVICT